MKKLRKFGIGTLCLFASVGAYATYENITTDPVVLYQRQLTILERGANDTKEDIKLVQGNLNTLEKRLARYQADWKDTRCLMAREEVEQGHEVNDDTRELCDFTKAQALMRHKKLEPLKNNN